MAKSELFNNPLIPWVLIAGVLSGGLWRAAPAPDAGKPGDSGASAARTDGESGPVPWISDLRPVMESLDATLGRATNESNGSRLQASADVALQPKGEARDRQIFQAIATLRTGLDDLVSPTEQSCGAVTALQAPAATLGAWLLNDDADDGKTRAAAAKGLLDEYRDWRLLEDLARRTQPDPGDSGAPTYAVDFIVATVPDYVDSNSGWLADQDLAALQSGMVQENFLFDRVKLVDWSRSQAGPVSVLASSRLHERQPGALIFRRVADRRVAEKTVQFQVVLVVLETPTAGVHQVALRNSLRFLRAWDACAKRNSRTLRVLGPSFSGSTLSLASVIGEAPFRAAFDPRIVISGSATAGENIQRMKDFSNGAIYRATVQPTVVLQERMAGFLESLNPAWKDGYGVALLTESNTAFGDDAGKGGKDAGEAPAAGGGATPPKPFANAKFFNFPLHIAQLRSDAPALAQPGALLSGPVIPLNMRETVPPSDLIPALRPQLTSPVVGSTVDSILDAIRHEKLSAVGILATDDRDVLFLAREVKRASPDVQLFLFGTHGLYLHPDYVPYLRGALVASSYALTLANQPEVAKSSDPQHRQPFPSMSAEGIFYATRALLSLTPEAGGGTLGYCPDGATAITNCVPVAPVSINVIGEDGYWTITAAASASTMPTVEDRSVDPDQVAPPSGLNVAELPRLPLQFAIGALLVLTIVAIHLVVLYRINRALTRGTEDQAFLELPFVRMLVPPVTFDRAARIHRLTVRVCLGLLALAAAWVEAVALPFLVRGEGVRPMMVVATVVTATVLLVAYAGWHTGPRRRLHPALTLTPPTSDAVPSSDGAVIRTARRPRSLTLAEIIGWSLFLGMLATMVLFATMVGQALAGVLNGGEWRLTLARIVGGGIVSPAALTVCLAVAFYAAVFMGARRLSLVGYGYSRLGQGSNTFRLFAADPEPAQGAGPRRGSMAAMLDMPAQNMTPFYPLVLLLGIVIAVLATWRVSTIDGRVFSWFLCLGTWTTLGLGLLQLVQAVALWNTARSHLKRLARTPIESRFHEIAAHVPWDISLAPPRLSELVPVARMADMVVRDFRTLGLASPYTRDDVDLCRNLKDFSRVHSEAEFRLGMRKGDLGAANALFSPPVYLELLDTEIGTRQHAALIQSDTWLVLWRLSDDIVALLEKTAWQRSSIVWCRMEAAELAVTGTEGKTVAFLQPPGRFAGRSLQTPTPFDDGPSSEERDGWFKRCEQLVALEMAFVLRDVVTRTVTCLFAAMLGLTLLTSSHLFYTFNGRASMLTIDMLAIGATALASVWILVDMERDHVLSRLRSTRPGRIDFNWEFIKRIAVYGVLPLLAVIAALFPEVGGTLFGWLEPLRKLTSF